MYLRSTKTAATRLSIRPFPVLSPLQSQSTVASTSPSTATLTTTSSRSYSYYNKNKLSSSSSSSSPHLKYSRRAPFCSSASMPKDQGQDALANGENGEHAGELKTGDFKYRPPYKIQTGAEDFHAVWEGGCHCGRVTYQLSRKEPLKAKYCHCTTCQVLHAAPFQWAAIFKKEDINFTNGFESLTWYDSPAKKLTHQLPCKVSCSYCRTPIMDEGRNMLLMYPGLIKGIENKDNAKHFRPSCHMFYPQRLLDIKDGITKFAGLDGQSDILDDEGNLIEKHDPEKQEKEKRQRQEDESKAESKKQRSHAPGLDPEDPKEGKI